MAIKDGMRTHDEGTIKRYRMPDLMTLEEMKIYFAGTYGVGIELVELSDEMREKATGVATLPYSYEPSPRDSDLALLRQKLGMEEDGEEVVKELHGRVMTSEQFEEKYGPQPPVQAPKEQVDEEKGSPDNTDQVDGPLPTYESSSPTEELDNLLGDKKQKE